MWFFEGKTIKCKPHNLPLGKNHCCDYELGELALLDTEAILKLIPEEAKQLVIKVRKRLKDIHLDKRSFLGQGLLEGLRNIVTSLDRFIS
jgi:hypothetical protein